MEIWILYLSSESSVAAEIRSVIATRTLSCPTRFWSSLRAGGLRTSELNDLLKRVMRDEEGRLNVHSHLAGYVQTIGNNRGVFSALTFILLVLVFLLLYITGRRLQVQGSFHHLEEVNWWRQALGLVMWISVGAVLALASFCLVISAHPSTGGGWRLSQETAGNRQMWYQARWLNALTRVDPIRLWCVGTGQNRSCAPALESHRQHNIFNSNLLRKPVLRLANF